MFKYFLSIFVIMSINNAIASTRLPDEIDSSSHVKKKHKVWHTDGIQRPVKETLVTEDILNKRHEEDLKKAEQYKSTGIIAMKTAKLFMKNKMIETLDSLNQADIYFIIAKYSFSNADQKAECVQLTGETWEERAWYYDLIAMTDQVIISFSTAYNHFLNAADLHPEFSKKVALYQKAASMKYEEAERLTETLSKGNPYLKVANCYIKAIEFHPDYDDTTELHDQANHFLNKVKELVQ